MHVRANYVIIDGFDIVGGGGHAVDVESMSSCENPQLHLPRQRRKRYFSATVTEWMTIDGNRCYRNASTNGYQTSGISVCHESER